MMKNLEAERLRRESRDAHERSRRSFDRLIAGGLRTLAREAHATARDKGWHDGPREDGTFIALMHEELSEALRVLRKDPDGYCPKTDYPKLAVELADVVIRVASYAEHKGLDLGAAVVAKMRYNQTRPYRHGDIGRV